MIDMTSSDEQKSNFITNILVDYSGENYYVVYADDTIEKNVFDIENYNEVLLQMEREFLSRKENYLKKLRHERCKQSIKVILTDLITFAGTFLVYNISCEEVLKVACMFVTVMIGIVFHQTFNAQIYELNSDLNTLYLMENFLDRKEEFAVDIEDEKTGEMKKWYVVNLSNIYKIDSESSLNKYTNEKVKLKKIPDFLKKKSGLSDV